MFWAKLHKSRIIFIKQSTFKCLALNILSALKTDTLCNISSFGYSNFSAYSTVTDLAKLRG
jgi:hypothetical protein